MLALWVQTLLLAGASAAVANNHYPADRIIYFVYYDDGDCETSPIGLYSMVESDDFTIVGANSDQCASEVLCALNATSPQCQSQATRRPANAKVTVTEAADIYSCDTSNAAIFLDECNSYKGEQCEVSSLYPDCHFRFVLRRDLVKDPTLIQNTNPPVEVDEQFYTVYYNDSNCTQFSGLRGLVTGNASFVTTSAETSCENAMLCLSHPEGAACQSLNTTGIVGVSGQVVNGTVYACNDEGQCGLVPPNACIPSSIYPQCHHRIVAASALLQDPTTFITSVPTSGTAGVATSRWWATWFWPLLF